ncbi:MAG: hypothetical protein R3246_15260, partial [Acidimicrobiia bacterium]|nr:hypothetical protein [Acidimicrobiia bacterium]
MPTQANRIHQETAADAFTLTSIDYGTHVNQLKSKIEDGTENGKKLSIAYKDNPAWVLVGDNLGDFFTVQYTGNGATATITITLTGDDATELKLDITGATDGSTSHTLDLTSPDFQTARQVFNYINRQIGYTATENTDSDVNINDVLSSQLDAAAAVDIKAAATYTVKGEIGALEAWVNSAVKIIGPIKGVTGARVAGKRLAPDNDAAFVNFAGGTAPATILADWQAALDLLNQQEIPSGLILLDTTDTSVQALVADFIDAEEADARPWRAVFGMAGGTSTADAINYAATYDRTKVGICYQRLTDLADPNVEHNPIMGAAAIGGGSGGVNFGVSAELSGIVLTSQRFRFGNIKDSDKFVRSERERAILGGLMVWRYNRGGIVRLSLGRSAYQEKGADGDLFLSK